MRLQFKTIDIKKNTDINKINAELAEIDMVMYFVMDITPNHKRLFFAIRDDTPIINKVKDPTIN